MQRTVQVVEINRHGHNGSSADWVHHSNAKSEADALDKIERLERYYANAKWNPGRAPKVPYRFRTRLETHTVEYAF